jgi:hypothetical protein
MSIFEAEKLNYFEGKYTCWLRRSGWRHVCPTPIETETDFLFCLVIFKNREVDATQETRKINKKPQPPPHK